jgi:hypothetical protein
MAFYLCPISAVLQYFTDTGIVLSGGKISTYLAGTTTPQSTAADSSGGVFNSNPIILNSAGRLPNVSIWQSGGTNLKIVITDSNNNQLGPTFDQVSGINDPATTTAALSNAGNGQGADLVANSVRSFDIFPAGRIWSPPTLSAGQTLIVMFEGGTTVNDGLGGSFYYSASSSTADDSINVIKPNVVGNGRLLRLYPGVSGQTFTGTLTGMTGATTGTVRYIITSRSIVTLQAAFTGTSAAGAPGNAMTMTGLPAQVTPPTVGTTVPCILTDNSLTQLIGWASVNTVGVITFGLGANPNFSGFTSGGTKGLPSGWTITYPLL